ncbi:MAG: type II toxin-antitoxin system HipA family toxin [Opitutaceae bacterium]|nr:type II toxin-antitoxin system HipA family toxin [Opitutaceae bacterium]
MLNVAYHGQQVGRLVEGNGRIFFEYDPQWLAQGHELSPLHLPRKPGVQYHHAKSFDGLPGLFHDSLPDSWGAKLMAMRFAEKGIKPNKVTPLMRLAYVGQRGMGALTYEPAWPEPGASPRLQQTKLLMLEREARAVMTGSTGTVLAHLVEAGGTAGGAYPKVVIAVNDLVPGEVFYGAGEYPAGYTPWLVKFDLSANNATGPMEHAYAAMARAAGIALPETRLFTVPDRTGTVRRHFGVQRFDRDGGERIHVHSFAGIAHKDPDKCDYRDLLLVAKALTRDMDQVAEGVRRMIFNVVASNRDDHGKNHAFVYRRGDWTFSPAFDLVFVSPTVQSMRGMGIGGEWRAPTLAQISGVAQDAGAESKAIRSITEQVAAAVQRWPRFAEEAAVPAEEIERVRGVLAAQRESLALRNVIATPPSVAVRPDGTRQRRQSRGISPG